MSALPIPRPMARQPGAGGILRGEPFQMAYATTDVAAAQALFARRYGVQHWTPLAGDLPEGGRIHVELAWTGPLMVELLFAEGPGSEVYRAVLDEAAAGFQLKHHHLGHFIHSAEEWAALMAEVEAGGWHMPLNRNNAGFLESCMIWAPELGHFLEYIHPDEAGRQFFADVARN